MQNAAIFLFSSKNTKYSKNRLCYLIKDNDMYYKATFWQKDQLKVINSVLTLLRFVIGIPFNVPPQTEVARFSKLLGAIVSRKYTLHPTHTLIQ